MAMDIVLDNVIPVIGFIVLQPGVSLTKDVNQEKLKKIQEQKLRGTIIDSKNPESLRELERFNTLAKEVNLPYRYVISGIGHWYPGDFLSQLDKALKDILNPNHNK